MLTPLFLTRLPVHFLQRGVRGGAPGGIWDCKYTDILLNHTYRDRPSWFLNQKVERKVLYTIQIWHERSYIFLYNISDSKARSMQELRINVEVSPKLAISQSQNQAKLYVHRGYEDHGAGHPDYYWKIFGGKWEWLAATARQLGTVKHYKMLVSVARAPGT